MYNDRRPLYCNCTVRSFKTPTTADVVSDDLPVSPASQLDIPCGLNSVAASLGAVTSRRVKDEVNAARKLELVINSSLHLLTYFMYSASDKRHIRRHD